MKVGITGTRNEITQKQVNEITIFLRSLPSITELHHGDCIGADVTVAKIAAKLGIRTVCHPPEKNALRANHKSDEIRKPKSYFARNRNIVDETDFLIVVPMQDHWSSMGGTWYTHDYAKKKNKNLKVFWPKKENDA